MTLYDLDWPLYELLHYMTTCVCVLRNQHTNLDEDVLRNYFPNSKINDPEWPFNSAVINQSINHLFVIMKRIADALFPRVAELGVISHVVDAVVMVTVVAAVSLNVT